MLDSGFHGDSLLVPSDGMEWFERSGYSKHLRVTSLSLGEEVMSNVFCFRILKSGD